MMDNMPKPIKFNEFKQTEPMSFVFKDHYFKLDHEEYVPWYPTFKLPNSPECANKYNSIDYTFTVGAIFTNAILMQKTNIDEELNDYMDDIMDHVSSSCDISTDILMKDIKNKGDMYDELLSHFALYFSAVPYNTLVKIVFNTDIKGYREYQLVISAIDKDEFDKFAAVTFPNQFSNVILNPRLFDIHMQKISGGEDPVRIEPVLRSEMVINNNMAYAVKGIYETRIQMSNNIEAFTKIATMVKNNSFIPMPFELKTDNHNNVATSSDENNKDYHFNLKCILMQYSKYANFIIFDKILYKLGGTASTSFANEVISDSPCFIKFAYSINTIVKNDNLIVALRLLPCRIVFTEFTAKLDIMSFSINSHRMEITFDDGYNGKDESLEWMMSTSLYNHFHHSFFSSYLNMKWDSSDNAFDNLSMEKPKMGLTYISYLSSKPITNAKTAAEFDNIDIKSYVNCNHCRVIRFDSKSTPKFFCDNKYIANQVKKKINTTMNGSIKSQNIYYPVKSTPTIIVYKSLAPVRKGGMFDIYKYDYLGICNVSYNAMSIMANKYHDTDERASLTDIINWGVISTPYIKSKRMALIPLSPGIIIIENRVDD